jgi:hypothetical protein
MGWYRNLNEYSIVLSQYRFHLWFRRTQTSPQVWVSSSTCGGQPSLPQLLLLGELKNEEETNTVETPA